MPTEEDHHSANAENHTTTQEINNPQTDPPQCPITIPQPHPRKTPETKAPWHFQGT